MKILRISLCCLLLFASRAPATDWAQWRGPGGNGVAPDGPPPPTEWSESKHVVWKAQIPGRGHGSPTIVGDLIFLTTADEQAGTQQLLAVQRATGDAAWRRTLYRSRKLPDIHAKNTHASATPACDGERVFATFYSEGKIRIGCLSIAGKSLWSRDVARFDPEYPFGYAASPLIYQDVVIATAESDAENALVAFDRKTGREKWRAQRPKNSSYSSPALLNVGGRPQLCISGGREVRAYDPLTGNDLWKAPAAAKHTAGTVIGHRDYVVASGGYPQSETTCIRADGSGRVVWKNRQKCYEQSMLIHDGFVYALTDGGVAYCWDVATGNERWKQRLAGPISASPVLVGDRIYVFNEKGANWVFRATPDSYQLIARNQLGTDVFPTPTFLDGRIYARVGMGSGAGRKEVLFCIGEG